MIYYLEGILKEKNPSRIIIDVGGVGYEVNIPFSIFESLPSPGKKVKMYTCLHMKDEKGALYGFLKPEDREFFLDLISISSVGPRSALRMLSRISPSRFKEAITEKNLPELTRIPGIGKKTAQRLILELGETLKVKQPSLIEGERIARDGIIALVSLGYSKVEAEGAIRKALKSEKVKKDDLAGLVKEALKYV